MPSESSNSPQPQKNNKKPDFRDQSLFNYFKDHALDTVAYVFSIVGILLFFFEPFYGGLIIGIITGLFFNDEIMIFVKTTKSKIVEQDYFKELGTHIILAALALAFFISAPGIFLGAAVVVGLKKLILSR